DHASTLSIESIGCTMDTIRNSNQEEKKMADELNNRSSKGTALITGASSGIGAVCADRLAKRGHDLILVARNRKRLETLAARLSKETGRSISVIAADLKDRLGLSRVEEVLRTDPSVTVLVNNAGVGAPARLLDADIATLEGMINLNVSSLLRLTYAVLPGFL